MPTYSDEVNIYNPNAISDAIDEAGETARNYITEVTSDGIMVADAGHGTSSGSITSGTTGWHIGGVLEFIRNGVARFWIGLVGNNTTPTVRIGKEYVANAADNESHMELDYHSLKLIDKEGDAYFHVSDLRDASGVLQYSESWSGVGDNTFMLTYPATDTDYDVKVMQGTTDVTSRYTITKNTEYITTSPILASSHIMTAEYETASGLAKAYTAGIRASGGDVGSMSFAEGVGNEASGANSHAEGSGNESSGKCSHSEGYGNTAFGEYSHAEGFENEADNSYAHAEGKSCYAGGAASHAEGNSTTASGECSHAQNLGTKALSDNQTAIGKYNVEDANGDYALIVGNGTADDARSNALAVGWDGSIDGVTQTTNTASDVLTAASGVTISNVSYAQWGKLAMLFFEAKPSAAKSGTWTAATLKAGKRPPFETPGVTASTSIRAYANSTGNVNIVGSVGANASQWVKITYIIA